MRLLQTCSDQVPSSAYNQTVQRAINAGDADRLGRPRRRLGEQRREAKQAACWWRQPASPVAGRRGGSGTRRFKGGMVEMSFQHPKKTDNDP